MDKWIWISILIGSVLTLGIILIKHNKYRANVLKIAVHWILAAVLLFFLNANEWTSTFAVPITPLSLSTIAILGIPGLALIQGIYILV